MICEKAIVLSVMLDCSRDELSNDMVVDDDFWSFLWFWLLLFCSFGLKFLRGCLVGPYYPYCCLYEYNTAACSLLVMLLSSSVGPTRQTHDLSHQS